MSNEAQVFQLKTTSIKESQDYFATLSPAVVRAYIRAYRTVGTWLQRKFLREISQATELPQKVWKDRVFVSPLGTNGRDGIAVWVGSNPVKLSHLGNVTWNRRMRGAMVGRKLFPGTWAWSEPIKTAPAVMERTGRFGRRGKQNLERIVVVKMEIHTAAVAVARYILPEAEAYFAAILRQEIEYAMTVEATNK